MAPARGIRAPPGTCCSFSWDGSNILSDLKCCFGRWKMSRGSAKYIKWHLFPVESWMRPNICTVWSVFTVCSVSNQVPQASSCWPWSFHWTHIILLVLLCPSSLNVHLRNKFHFSEVHRSMNPMHSVQRKWCSWVHTLMNHRKNEIPFL